jgi:hypothetical protein
MTAIIRLGGALTLAAALMLGAAWLAAVQAPPAGRAQCGGAIGGG